MDGDERYSSKEYIQDFGSNARLTALDDACRTTPSPSDAGLVTGIDAVFVGSGSCRPHPTDGAPRV